MTSDKTVIPTREGRLSRNRAADAPAARATVAPHYEIKESDDALGLEVFLPGVKRDNLNLSVEGRELLLTAGRSWNRPAEWTAVWVETGDFDYRLHLMLPEGLEQEKIHAELKNGVLRLTLPKSAGAQKRKIKIE